MVSDADLPRLKRNNRASPWRTLGLRAAAATGLLVVAFMLLWFDRVGLKDNLDDHISFTDTLYFTIITITTVGYGDIVPVNDRARLIDAFAPALSIAVTIQARDNEAIARHAGADSVINPITVTGRLLAEASTTKSSKFAPA